MESKFASHVPEAKAGCQLLHHVLKGVHEQIASPTGG